MKKFLLAYCLVAGMTMAHAQGTHPVTGTPEEKAKIMKKELSLTDKQTEKIAAIYKESAEKFDKIKKDEHGNTDKMVVAVRPLREATVKKIKAILTPQQAVKYDKMLMDTKSGGNGWSDGWSAAN